ncbi:MAG: hypothetical protein M3Q97_10540 [Bacteroidota bacterium]|nr:hypothetical protein [Bacteroidota bacterium]
MTFNAAARVKQSIYIYVHNIYGQLRYYNVLHAVERETLQYDFSFLPFGLYYLTAVGTDFVIVRQFLKSF